MKHNRNLHQTGFTLIELLIILALIGILSTFAVVIYNGRLEQARDVRRLGDIVQIQKALELYYNEYGEYPAIATNGEKAVTTDAPDGCGYGWCDLEIALEDYISALPRDPLGLQNTYAYFYNADDDDSYQTYGLMVVLESSTYQSLMQDDGGAYNTRYEVGRQPHYCMSMYTTYVDGAWLPVNSWSSWPTADTCRGGN